MRGKMLTATAYPPPPQASPKKDSRKLLVIVLLIVIIIVSAGVLFYLATNKSSTSPTPTPSATPTSSPTGGATPTPTSTATATPTPTGGGASVAGASSLQYSVSITNSSSGASIGAYTFRAKNAGTSDMMIRIDFTDPSGDSFVYIVNGALQQAWMQSGGQWIDLSSTYTSQWSNWDSTFTSYKNSLASWAGVGDYTYTSYGETIRIYDITVNPSLADSLFQHS
jgi:hypothetical protein